jgi:ribosomal protein S18 acetylase RimI-like enzyme
MTEASFVPARRADARTIARLYQISADGVADYIWTTLAEPGEDPLDVGARRYAREGTAFSYENCTLAKVGDAVAGMLVAFPMHVDPAASAEDATDPVLAPYARLEEDDSYYVCGVALFPEFRGRGLGRRLMLLAEEHARARGYRKLSLIVFQGNAVARGLYERLGYREVMRAAIVPHPLIHHAEGDALLMVKALA